VDTRGRGSDAYTITVSSVSLSLYTLSVVGVGLYCLKSCLL